ncbi:hypothetical protein ACOME3_001912 [Neoechinorhynchus agilis]
MSPFVGELANYGVESVQRRLKQMINDDVTDRDLETILVQCCFVTDKERSEKYKSQNGRIDDSVSDVSFKLNEQRRISIPARVRETAFELLFDSELSSNPLHELVGDVIERCPIDVRPSLIQNIVVTGGGADVKGISSRLEEEIRDHFKRKGFLKLKDEVKVHRTCIPGEYTGWLGGSLIGSTDAIETHLIHRSPDQKLENGTIK